MGSLSCRFCDRRFPTAEMLGKHMELMHDQLGQAVVTHDAVNHPKHYVSHPSGVECIQVTEHMGFNLGNAVKYIWRADLKNDALEDLRKAAWYIGREIAKRESSSPQHKAVREKQ